MENKVENMDILILDNGEWCEVYDYRKWSIMYGELWMEYGE